MVMKLLSFPCGAHWSDTPPLSLSVWDSPLSIVGPTVQRPLRCDVLPSRHLADSHSHRSSSRHPVISSALALFQRHRCILAVLRHPPSLSCGSLFSSPSFAVSSRPSSLAPDPPRALPLIQSHNSFARAASSRHGQVRRSPLLRLVLGCGWERGAGISGGEGGGGSEGLERVEALGDHEAAAEVTAGGGRGGHREGDGGEERAIVRVEGGDAGGLLGPWDLWE
jgi:hypothetical protein